MPDTSLINSFQLLRACPGRGLRSLPFQAASCPAAARSGTPGLPARPPETTHTPAPAPASRPAAPELTPNARYQEGRGQPGPAPLRATRRTVPATMPACPELFLLEAAFVSAPLAADQLGDFGQLPPGSPIFSSVKWDSEVSGEYRGRYYNYDSCCHDSNLQAHCPTSRRLWLTLGLYLCQQQLYLPRPLEVCLYLVFFPRPQAPRSSVMEADTFKAEDPVSNEPRNLSPLSQPGSPRSFRLGLSRDPWLEAQRPGWRRRERGHPETAPWQPAPSPSQRTGLPTLLLPLGRTPHPTRQHQH